MLGGGGGGGACVKTLCKSWFLTSECFRPEGSETSYKTKQEGKADSRETSHLLRECEGQ
jgi:hypothetical protein